MTTGEKRPLVREVRFASIGSCVPPKILTNADLERMVDTSDEWILTRTGISERHIADETIAASDLCIPAARPALERAGVTAGGSGRHRRGHGDAATWTSRPPSCIVQAALGATRAFCFDVSAGCSGFLYAIQVGRSLIASGIAETVLVIGVEILTKITDWTDRNTCVLFGDAAGAAILRPADGRAPDPGAAPRAPTGTTAASSSCRRAARASRSPTRGSTRSGSTSG